MALPFFNIFLYRKQACYGTENYVKMQSENSPQRQTRKMRKQKAMEILNHDEKVGDSRKALENAADHLPVRMTTLCYLEKADSYLMLHRVVKKHDENKDTWIGVGSAKREGDGAV